MHISKKLTILPAIALLAACSGGGDEQPSGSDQAETEAKAPAAAPEPELSDIAKKGKVVFLKCRSCHTVKAGDPHLTGPNLHGFVDQKAGTREGYVYSEALLASGITWDDAALDEWYQNPMKMIPGTKMVLAGITKPEDRAALTAYMREVTK